MTPEFDGLPQELQSKLEPFDISKEYVPDPLVPDGVYRGIVVKVELESEGGMLNFTVQLQGNEGIFCTDKLTPVDGKQSKFTLWLPREGDSLVHSKYSALTVRQDRIRGIKKFSDKMKLEIGTESAIKEAIEDKRWMSIPVVATIKSRLYEGEIYNQIKKMERQTA